MSFSFFQARLLPYLGIAALIACKLLFQPAPKEGPGAHGGTFMAMQAGR